MTEEQNDLSVEVLTNVSVHFHEWHISRKGGEERILKAERKKKKSGAGGREKSLRQGQGSSADAAEVSHSRLWAVPCLLSAILQFPNPPSAPAPPSGRGCPKSNRHLSLRHSWNFKAGVSKGWVRAVPKTFISFGACCKFSVYLSKALGLASCPTNSHSSH